MKFNERVNELLGESEDKYIMVKYSPNQNWVDWARGNAMSASTAQRTVKGIRKDMKSNGLKGEITIASKEKRDELLKGN
jgi:hypothetical protein